MIREHAGFGEHRNLDLLGEVAVEPPKPPAKRKPPPDFSKVGIGLMLSETRDLKAYLEDHCRALEACNDSKLQTRIEAAQKHLALVAEWIRRMELRLAEEAKAKAAKGVTP